MSRTPEEIRDQRSRERVGNIKNSSNKNNNKSVFICLLVIALLIITFVILSLTVFFKVDTIEVEGESMYSQEQVETAISFVKGSNLLLIDKEKIETAICENLPYIKSVNVVRDLPTTVKVELSKNYVSLAVKSNNGYVLVDSSFKCLEIVPSSSSYTAVYGVKVKTAQIGKSMEFEDATQYQSLDLFVRTLLLEDVTKINQIDITDPQNIRAIYGGKHIWKLGNTDNIEYKVRFGKTLSETETEVGVVDLSALSVDKNNAYFHAESIVNTFDSTPSAPKTTSSQETKKKSDVSSTVSSQSDTTSVDTDDYEEEDVEEEEYEETEEEEDYDEEVDEDYDYDEEETDEEEG